MVPPLPPEFQISAVSFISSDHAVSFVVVLLATHQQADDVIIALLKEVHFLFANGMFRFFFINYFQFSVMILSPCMNQEKAKAESNSQIEDLLYYQSMNAKWFGWLVSELAAFKPLVCLVFFCIYFLFFNLF
jgi:hypothetical protein